MDVEINPELTAVNLLCAGCQADMEGELGPEEPLTPQQPRGKASWFISCKYLLQVCGLLFTPVLMLSLVMKMRLQGFF